MVSFDGTGLCGSTSQSQITNTRVWPTERVRQVYDLRDWLMQVDVPDQSLCS